MPEIPSNSLAVIGGGLAGLAAAEAACRHGLRVEIFEQAARLGGRAGSFDESYNGALVDYSPHAAMGCCTNFLDLCRRTGVADCFRRENNLHFIGPDNRLCRFVPSRWLPAPFHLLPALKELDFLASTERKHLVRALKQLVRAKRSSDPKDHADETTFGDWLGGQNQSANAIQFFWSVIIQGALSETVENVSLAAARKVIVDGFLASRKAGEMILPNMPLAEIFDCRVGQWLTDRGVKIHRRERVMWIESDESGQLLLVTPEGDVCEFDHAIVTAAWHQTGNLFPPMLLEELPEIIAAQKLSPGTITAVHLWFDRPITPLPHAILVGKLSQWIFGGTCSFPRSRVEMQFHDAPASHDVRDDSESDSCYFYQVVISAAHRLAVMEKDALLDRVLKDIAEAFPEAKSARLLHSRVVVYPEAVFAMRPGVSRYRPAQAASLPNLFLAGDWTATGWPGTMEGAVRSGYLAVESLLKRLGRPTKILVPDLPRGFWARRIIGD